MKQSKEHSLRIKRIYLPPEESDGARFLVDRLWPRGIKKETAALDAWMKDIAPSNEIRKQFNHQAENAARFRQQYLQELDTDPQAKEFAKECHALLAKKNITLLYSARDEQYNNAVILKEWLERN